MINTVLSGIDIPMSHSSTSPASLRGEAVGYRAVSEFLTREVPYAELLLLTTLPRGGVQIVQPQKLADTFLKPYLREWQAQDTATWHAIEANKAVRGSGKYVDEFLKLFGYAHVAAVPVYNPVFDGYVGALQLHRTEEQGPFTDAELAKLSEAAERLGTHDGRLHPSGSAKWMHRPPTRQVVLDEKGNVVLFEKAFDALDERLQQQMVDEARQRLHKMTGEPLTSTRLLLPDSSGDNWTFNAVVYAKYPALHTGPVVFFCLQPICPEWGTLKALDFAADPEMARLMPAIKFMQADFSRGPTLTEIAKTVHLSPFHFHRRFTELMGLTPKHFLLECQIHDAKTHLLAGEKELARIASDCGFAHQSHFTSRFKQATGLTPTRWRRMAHDRYPAE